MSAAIPLPPNTPEWLEQPEHYLLPLDLSIRHPFYVGRANPVSFTISLGKKAKVKLPSCTLWRQRGEWSCGSIHSKTLH